MYLRFTNGQITYPYSPADLRRDRPNTSFPHTMATSLLAEFDVFPVTPTGKPAASNPVTKNVVELQPVLIGQTWTQQWGEVDAPAEEVLRRQREVADAAAKDAIKVDVFVTNFIAMTPAQLDAYMDANVTNLAEARAVLKKLARLILLMARREFR